MKKAFAACALFVVVASAIGANDVFQRLKIAKADAASEVLSALGTGSVGYYRVAEAFRGASPATRAALTEQVLIWTKSYVNSPQFAKDYAKFREDAKPGREQGESVDQELARVRAERQAELEEMRKNIASMPAEYRKMAEDAYKAAVAAQKEFDTPENRKMERDAIAAGRQEDAEQDQAALEYWKKTYPADHRALVKRRLTEFLNTTANVDYAAQLVNKGGRKRFANAAYEAKSPDWKLAYRAGKEPTEKARAFAKAWLAEMK